MYDPLKLAEEVRPLVSQGRSEGTTGKWYGGIATADCTGYCLKCVFCWSGGPRDDPTIGEMLLPDRVFAELDRCAESSATGRSG